MSIDLDPNEWVEIPFAFMRPTPTRAETIKEVWRLYGERFDWDSGQLVVQHDLGIIPDIVFEAKDYCKTVAIEAEGVVVAKYPNLLQP